MTLLESLTSIRILLEVFLALRPIGLSVIDGLISVIIPIYNAEKTLVRCLDSLLLQEGVRTEILLVDDGSTDSSSDICKAYVASHENIRLISQNNQGVSAARNVGLHNACGEFVYFMDSDDYLCDPIMLKKMSTQFCDPCVSVCCCGFVKESSEGKAQFSITNSTCKVNRLDYLRDMLLSPLGGYLWNRLYRFGVLLGASFDEHRSFAEDLLFNCSIWEEIDCVAYIPGCSYVYMVIPSSLTHVSECFVVDGEWQFDGLVEKLYDVLPRDGYVERLLEAREAQQAINEVVLLSGKKEHGNLRAQLIDVCRKRMGAYYSVERSLIKRQLYSMTLIAPEWLLVCARALLTRM